MVISSGPFRSHISEIFNSFRTGQSSRLAQPGLSSVTQDLEKINELRQFVLAFPQCVYTKNAPIHLSWGTIMASTKFWGLSFGNDYWGFGGLGCIV